MEAAPARRRNEASRGDGRQVDVPPVLVPEILRRVPLQHRMGICALVCRDWRGAAVTGTEELVVSFPPATAAGGSSQQMRKSCCWRQRSAGLAAFLAVRGGALSSLTVTAEGEGCRRLALPWQSLRNLRSLTVTQAEMVTYWHSCAKDGYTASTAPAVAAVAPATESAAAELAQLTALTNLQLKQCVCRAWQLGLTNQLAALKRLQQLSLCDVTEVSGHSMAAASTEQQSRGCQLAAALSQLTALQRLHLELEADVATWEVVASLKHLAQLQDLELGVVGAERAVRQAAADICWADLPPTLTALTLNTATDAGWQFSCCSSSKNSISALQCHMTALQKLVLVTRKLQPASLAGLPQLSHLSITADVLAPKGSLGLHTLLSVCKQQRQLRMLELDCPADVLLPPAQVDLYASLTASSSSLEELRLSLFDLPEGALDAMFSACGQQLPKLRKLWLGADGLDSCTREGGGVVLLPLEPGELQLVLRCCTALEDLFFVPCCYPDDEDDNWICDRWQVSPFTWADVAGQMTRLHSLGVAGPGVDDDFTVHFLAQLTGLQDLRVSESQNFTSSELEVLTCLTGLTGLTVKWCHHHTPDDLRPNQVYSNPSFNLNNLAAEGCAPDVWQQLQARCWLTNHPAPADSMMDELDSVLETTDD